MKNPRIPMPAFATLLSRFPIGSLIISHCVDTLIRQDLLDVRRHICSDWGDMRAEHRRWNSAVTCCRPKKRRRSVYYLNRRQKKATR